MSGKIKKCRCFDSMDLYELQHKYNRVEEFEFCPIKDVAKALKKCKQVEDVVTDEVEVGPDEYEELLIVTIR